MVPSHSGSMFLVIQLDLQCVADFKSNFLGIKSFSAVVLFIILFGTHLFEVILQRLGLSFTMDDKLWGIINNDSDEHLHNDEDVLDREDKDTKL